VSDVTGTRLFGSNGIRGIAGTEIPIEMVRDLGRALGTTLPAGSTVCIGNDARATADAFRQAFARGLNDTGVDAVFLGRMPTPALAGTTALGRYDAGVMITASHNPPEYNGIKVYRPDGMGYGPAEEKAVEAAYFARDFGSGAGTIGTDEGALDAYRAFVLRQAAGLETKLRVVVDAANGAMAGFATRLFAEAGVDVEPLHDTPKAIPDRDSEPKPASLAQTVRHVAETGADLAVCFDGDADRVVFCDRQGFLGFNEMIGFIAREWLKESPSKRVATTVETGRLVDLAVADVGGEILRGVVGDVSVAHLTQEAGCALGVEQVGHYIHPRIGYYPDTLYIALFLMSRIGNPQDIRDFYATIPRLHYEKAGFACPNHRMPAVTDYLAQRADRFGAREVNSLDGLRLELDDAWVLLRASGTQPLIRVIAEAESEARLHALLQAGSAFVTEALAATAG
jgi:phosphoglucosamine mutase